MTDQDDQTAGERRMSSGLSQVKPDAGTTVSSCSNYDFLYRDSAGADSATALQLVSAGICTMLLMRNLPSRLEQRSPLAMLRVQLGAIFVMSVLVPLAIATFVAGENPLEHTGARVSTTFSLLAATVGLGVHRRLIAFPGTASLAYLLPAFLLAYAAFLVLTTMLRLPYSSVITVSGFVCSTAFTFLATVVAQRGTLLRCYVVPFGEVSKMADTPGADWIVLQSAAEERAYREIPIVADLTYDLDPHWERMLAEAAISGQPVYHFKQLRESLTGKVEIEHLSENSFGSLLPNMVYHKVKRATDFLFALATLPLLMPLFVIVGSLVRLDSPGPAVFRQERMGYKGRPFRVFKFRTMRDRASEVSSENALADAMTQTRDDRITRLGNFLRRTRIDELPQLINVLRGEMSLIGPRPEAIALSEWYEREIPFYLYRHIVRPGITGWAQVNQGHVTEVHEVHEKLHYDFYYIKYFSPWLDMLIAMRTIAIVFTGKGAR